MMDIREGWARSVAQVTLWPNRIEFRRSPLISKDPLRVNYSGLPWCCTQTSVSAPAENVLESHASERVAYGIVELVLRP